MKKEIFAGESVFVDYHKTRGFYNMIKSSQVIKCKCSLCEAVLAKLKLCKQCSNDISATLGIDADKPVQATYSELDNNDIMAALVYIFDGRPFKKKDSYRTQGLTTQVGDTISYSCKECSQTYFIDSDKIKLSSMLLKISMLISVNNIDKDKMNKNHMEITCK